MIRFSINSDDLVAGIIVAGWDPKCGGQVYSIPLGGMCMRQSVTIGGSGSSYVYGFIKEFYKPQMAKEDCVNFVKKSNNLIEYFPLRIEINDLLVFQLFSTLCPMMAAREVSAGSVSSPGTASSVVYLWPTKHQCPE